MEKKAIIIGAGPAGLTAAYRLLTETDVKPVILEESDVIGGISRTAVHGDNRIDIGGHRFFSKSSEVTDLWKQIMPLQGALAKDDRILGREKPLVEGGPDPEKEEHVMLIRDRVSRIFYLHKFFDYPISMRPATFINMGFGRTMKAGFGYLGSIVHKREEKSLEDFYINRFGRPLYEMFFEDYTEKLWGVHPSQIAPDWGAQRVKGLSLWKAFISIFKNTNETSLIEQFWYPKKGPGQLWETFAEEVQRLGGEIHFHQEVVKVATQDGQITSVTARDEAGSETEYTGDYYFSTMSVKDLVIAMGDKVPEPVRSNAANLPYRDFITVGLLVNKLQLENKTKAKTLGNIVPDCWIYMQEREVRVGRLQIFNNWSPYMLKDPEHTVWIGMEYFCDEGDEMWSKSDEEFTKFAIGELSQIGVINPQDVLDSVRIRIKKAYPAYFGTYAEFDGIRSYLDGYENLFCIGRNGQHRYNNMDHSMLTAMRAVDLVRAGSTDKSALWDVNTEEEYHETKAN